MKAALNNTDNSTEFNPQGLKLLVWVSFTALALTIIAWLIFGFFIEDHTGLPINIQSGLLTENLMIDNFYIFCQTFTSYFYSLLFRVNNQIAWVGIFFTTQLLASYVIFATASVIELGKSPLKQASIFHALSFALLAYILFFLPNFIFFSGVKVSYIATSFALFGIAYVSNLNIKRKSFLFLYLLLVLLFFFSFTIRYESGLGAILIAGSFCFFISKNIYKTFLSFILPALIILITLIYIHKESDTIPFLKSSDSYIYYLSDATYQPNLFSNDSKVDSMKKLAVLSYFFFDEKKITPDFIESMAKEKASLILHNESGFNEILNITFDILLPCLERNCLLTIFYLISIVVTIFVCRKRTAKLGLTLYYFSIALIICLLAYFIKMEDRIYVSILTVATLFNAFMIINKLDKANFIIHPKSRLIIYTIFLVLISLFFYRFIRVASIHKENGSSNSVLINEIDRLAKGKVLLLDVTSPVFTYSSVLNLIKFDKVKRILFYDNGQLAFLPIYKKYLDSNCDCNSAEADQFYSFLKNNKEQVIIMSNEKRLNLISSYMSVVHDFNIKFYIIDTLHLNDGNIYKQNELKFYGIE